MKIIYLAHACFLIETPKKKIVTDPYEPGSYGGSLGYRPPDVEADIITVSHQHFDHNATREIKGKPYIKETPQLEDFAGLKIWGMRSFHDSQGGRERGRNTIFLIEDEGLRLAHLGDQGVIPPQDWLERLRDIHILLIPVGGFFTIGPEEATQILNTLKTPIVIPMHYKTEKLGFDIKSVEGFLEMNKDKDIQIKKDSLLEVEKDNLPSTTRIVVLKHLR